MHIDDWNDEFLSKFSPEEYVNNLTKAKIENAMLYFQSHAGLCYYPTKTGQMHKAFRGREDMLKKTVDLCHKNGIYVTGYYSLNYNTAEHDLHKQWRMLRADGTSGRESGVFAERNLAFASTKQSRYGLCCPNNNDYRAFVYEQIDEMLEYFDCEGMFFDMPFWPHTCYCESCRKRWRDEVGGEIPISPEVGSPEYIMLIKKKYEWMGEWISSVTEYVKKKAPEMSVEHNFASAIAGNSENGCGEEVNAACDFVGGDLYGGMINHSFASKFYKNITKNQPFDYMFSRCKPALRTHTLTKSYDEMKAEVMLTAAHHGATLVIDAIDPVGTMDGRVYERIGKVFEYEKQYEPYLTGEMLEDVGIYYSIKSRFNSCGEEFDSLGCCLSVAEILIENHIPFGVTGNFHDINKYKLLIIPYISEMEKADFERIIKYAENGGNVLICGTEGGELAERLAGIKIKGRTEENNVYIAPQKGYEALFGEFDEKYPMPFDGTAPITETDYKENVVATITLPYTKSDEKRFASIHSDPPGIKTEIPAMIMTNCGKGRVIWSALNTEAVKICEYKELVMRLVHLLADKNEMSFKSNAPEDVEITAFDNADSITVNAVKLNEKAKAKTVPPFEISVKLAEAPTEIILLPEGEPTKFSYKNGYAVFLSKPLDVFDMYKITKF